MTPVKKSRAPRKPKVAPVAEVTPVKKPRAPRKPKVAPVEAPIEDKTETTDTASIDKFISELQADQQEKVAKENSFFNKHKPVIYETLGLIAILSFAYLAGYCINSSRVETPKENVKF
jgi:hypothetical protein